MEAPRRDTPLRSKSRSVVASSPGTKPHLLACPAPSWGPGSWHLVCQLAHAQRLGVVGCFACSRDSLVCLS